MTESHTSPWEKIRRALGKLVSAVQVHDMAPASLALPLTIFGEEALRIASCQAGPQEASWSPRASLVSWPPLCPAPGGENANLAAVTAIVGLDAALSPLQVPVWAAPSPVLAATVHHQEFDSFYRPSPAIYAPSVTFAAGVVNAGSSCLAVPKMARLLVEPPRLPKKTAHTPHWGRGRDVSPLQFSGIRVRAGMNVCVEAPLIRTRRPPPPGLRLAQAFAAERRQLAQTAQVDLEDVALWGVYPQVPVAAIRRLALGEDGQALSLWLKPEALSAAAAGRPARLVTLIIGRLRSTGRMIQAIS